MIFSDIKLCRKRQCFLVFSVFSLSLLFVPKVFSQNCDLSQSGDAVCDVVAGIAGGGGVTSFVTTGASVFGGGSTLFQKYGSDAGVAASLVGLESLYDGVSDSLKNLLLQQVLSALSENNAISRIQDIISQIGVAQGVLDGLSDLSILGVNFGGDLQAYAQNRFIQQLSKVDDIAGTNIADIASNVIGDIPGTGTTGTTGTAGAPSTGSIGPANVDNCESALLDIVQSAESGRSDPYNIVFGSSRPTIDGRPLTQWTIAELQNWQRTGVPCVQNGRQTKCSAAGRYQIVPGTLATLLSRTVPAGTLRTTDLFDENAQDLLAVELANSQGGLSKYKAGEQGLEQTIYKIATIWAGLEYTPGKGVYDKDGLNGAKPGTYNSVKSVLLSEACTNPNYTPPSTTAPAIPAGGSTGPF